MTAEIYPIKRLPRSFSFFDYAVPPGMLISRGSLVSIPFRHEMIYGVVRKQHARAHSRQLKSIEKQVSLYSLTEQELDLYENLAKETLQSVSSLLYTALPRHSTQPDVSPAIKEQSLMVRTSEAGFLRSCLTILGKQRQAFICCKDIRQMTALILKYAQEHPFHQILILAPYERDVKRMAPFFTSYGLSLVTGEQIQSLRFTSWIHYRQKRHRILLGTRVAALLPLHGTDTIFVIESSDSNHKQEKKNPRYDTRWIAQELQKTNHCSFYCFDVFPRVEENIFFEHLLHAPSPSSPHIVDREKERQASEHPLLTYTAMEAIQKTLLQKKRVLLFYNKKGFGESLACQDCGQLFLCKQCNGVYTPYETQMHCHHCGERRPLPLSCPSCRGNRLREKGYGNRNIKCLLEKLFPQYKVGIIEKGKQESPEAELLLITSSFFEELYNPFDPLTNIGLFIHLDADLSLYEPQFRSIEQTMFTNAFLQGMACRLQAEYLIQTRVPHLFEEYLFHPEEALKKDEQMRQLFSLPPFCQGLRISYRAKEERIAYLALQTILPLLKKYDCHTLLGPKKDAKGQLTISLRMYPHQKSKIFAYLQTLPDAYIIDTNVVS